jgi:4-coumarate--CoA ligase
VTVISSGQSSLPLLFWAVVAAGGIYSAASSAYTPSELARQIKDGSSNLLVCSAELLETALEAAGSCGVSQERVLLLKSRPKLTLTSAYNYHIPISNAQLDWKHMTDRSELENTTACILYSSGTTGLPKGVVISQMNLVSASTIPTFMLQKWKAEQQAAGKPPFQYKTLAHLPVSHIAGVLSVMVNAFLHGGTVYWMQKFDFVKFLDYHDKFKLTFLVTVPPIYLLILKSPLVENQFRNIQVAVTAAAPLGPEQQRAASAKLGGSDVYIAQTWGLTESTGSATLMPFGDRDESGSVAYQSPNMLMRLVNDDYQDVKPGERGEILLKGPNIISRYHNNPGATKDAFIDGWFKTGDIGEIHNEKIYIVDRKKVIFS